MANKRRLSAALLALFVIVAMTVSLCVVAHEACHSCIGRGCRSCAIVAICQNALETLFAAFFALVIVIFGVVSVIMTVKAGSYSGTPVSLKVKLLN